MLSEGVGLSTQSTLIAADFNIDSEDGDQGEMDQVEEEIAVRAVQQIIIHEIFFL